jgi:hypothetical protein
LPPRNCACYRIQPLFENRDPRIEPIAIIIQDIHSRCQSPRLLLDVSCKLFDLLRLPREVGGRHLIAPNSCRRLAGEQGQDDCGHRANRPRSQPPERSSIEFILLGQEPGKHSAGVIRVEALRQIVGILCHGKFRVLTESTGTLTGKRPSPGIFAFFVSQIRPFHAGIKRSMTAQHRRIQRFLV